MFKIKNNFFCRAVQLSGPSMIPTFNVKQDGDLVITEHLSAQFRTIKKYVNWRIIDVTSKCIIHVGWNTAPPLNLYVAEGFRLT